MTFDDWWEDNRKQFCSDSLHMSEKHMAKMVWDAAIQTMRQGLIDNHYRRPTDQAERVYREYHKK